MQALKCILIGLGLSLVSCGPVAGSLVSASMYQNLSDPSPDMDNIFDGIFDGLSCAFSTLFGAPSIAIKFSEPEFLELDGAISVYRLVAADFWDRLPQPMRYDILTRLTEAYERKDPDGIVRRQPLEFYTKLFAKGLLDVRNRGYRSNWIQISKVIKSRNKKGEVEMNPYGVFVEFSSDRFKREPGKSPFDEMLYCP